MINITSKIIASTDEDARFINDKIVEFNKTKVPLSQDVDFIALNFHVKNEEGLVIAGINSLMYYWYILHIDVLFVDEKYRDHNIGRALLSKAENKAKLLGAKLAHLDTFDWQAKDFYLKSGYEIFGILGDCPEGHQRYYLKKIL